MNRLQKLCVAILLPIAAQAAEVTACPSGCTYTTWQAAIDGVTCGDTITVDSLVGAATLRDQTCPTNAYTVIRGKNHASFAPGVQVSPTDPNLVTLTVSSSQAILLADRSAHHYKIQGGIAIKLTGSQDTTTIVQLFAIGAICGCDTDQQIAYLPHHLIFDQVVIQGLNRDQASFHNCIVPNTGFLMITNSWIGDCFNGGPNGEAHGLAIWNAQGPFYFRNNTISGSQIDSLIGGANPSVPGLVPQGYVNLGNHFYRPWLWRVRTKTTNPSGTCGYDANGGEAWNNISSGHWWLCVTGTWADQGMGTSPQTPDADKNAYEWKNVNGALAVGNVMSGAWEDPNSGQQRGSAFLLNQVDQFNPAAMISAGEFAYNKFVNTAWGIVEGTICTSPPCYFGVPHDLYIHDNVGLTGTPDLVSDTSAGTPNSIQLAAYGNRSYDHNTFLLNRDAEAYGGAPILAALASIGTCGLNSNIFNYGGTASSPTGGFYDGFFGGGGLWNAVTNTCDYNRQIGRNAWMNTFGCIYSGMTTCPQANSMAGVGSVVDDTRGYVASISSYESASYAAAGITNYAAGDYTLLSSSPYYRMAQGGVDLGADIAKVNEMTAGAISGTPNPYLDFKISYIRPTSTTAQLGYNAYSTAACTVTAAIKPGATPVFTDSGSTGPRWRTLSITSLVGAARRYWLDIDCGGHHNGQFFYTQF